jgi:hypothetical protein
VEQFVSNASKSDSMRTIHRAFRLKKPCADCPFLKVGAIDLAPGRLEGIKQRLLSNDQEGFPCHSIALSSAGGFVDDDGEYHASKDDAMCAGAAAFLLKKGTSTVAMRIAFAVGVIKPTDWDKTKKLIVD